MAKKYSVLIIEDHSLIADAFQKAFKRVSNQEAGLLFKISVANNCDQANEKIEESSLHDGFDIIILDISLPPSKDGTMLSGEDIGVRIKELFPRSKIIISTSYCDSYRVKSIIKSVNPEAFLIKGDIDFNELLKAINTILENELYYSKSVLRIFKTQIFNEYIIDKMDRDLLFELSNGTKMSGLPKYLPMSMRTIEKRKSRLKEIFNIQDEEDKELIRVAREKGFI